MTEAIFFILGFIFGAAAITIQMLIQYRDHNNED